VIDLRPYVRQNQQVIEFVKHATPGVIDKYIGTLDHATARFNTILLRASEDSVKTYEHAKDIDQCYHAIQSFYEDTKRYLIWPYLFKPIMVLKLHLTGKIRIPKIKLLLEKFNN
tara:strand:+ start:436 stop:777 length:342 start_codon:yes stop_codon:yes gene_type:complete